MLKGLYVLCEGQGAPDIGRNIEDTEDSILTSIHIIQNQSAVQKNYFSRSLRTPLKFI